MKISPRKRFALDLSKFTLRLSKHAQRMATEKNFTLETIEKTFRDPTRVYPSGSHPGQYRITGHGLCLVGLPEKGAPERKHEIIENPRSKDDDQRENDSKDDTKMPKDESVNYFTIITIYQDNILTPPRTDQLNTPEGRRYAERYLKGLGRG